MASMDFSFPSSGGAMVRTSGGRRGRPVSTSGSGMGDIDTSFFEEMARRRMAKEDAAEDREKEEYEWRKRQRRRGESERRSDRFRARREREQEKGRSMQSKPRWAQERVGTWGIPTWTPTLEARQSGKVSVAEGALPGAEFKSSVGEIEDAALARKREQDQDFEDRKRRAEYLERTRERPRQW